MNVHLFPLNLCFMIYFNWQFVFPHKKANIHKLNQKAQPHEKEQSAKQKGQKNQTINLSIDGPKRYMIMYEINIIICIFSLLRFCLKGQLLVAIFCFNDFIVLNR